jgi:hypothetical protein
MSMGEDSIYWFVYNNKTQEIADYSDNSEAVLTNQYDTLNAGSDTLNDLLYNLTSSEVYWFVANQELNMEEYSTPDFWHTVPALSPEISLGTELFSDDSIFMKLSAATSLSNFISIAEAGDYYFADGNDLYVKIPATYVIPDNWGTLSYFFKPDNTYQYLVTGIYTANEVIDPSNLGYVDVRVKGGGIKETSEIAVRNINDEIDWYWDIGYWDGKSAPLMSTYLAEFPWWYRNENTDEEVTTTQEMLDSDFVKT